MSEILISKRIIVINSASSVLKLVLSTGVLIWLQQYLLKNISPEEYSLIPIILSIMAIFPVFTTILTSGISRFVVIAYAKGEDTEVTKICSTMFPILLVVSFLLMGLGGGVAWNIDYFLNIPTDYIDDAKVMFFLMVFSISARLPLTVFLSGFTIRQKLVWQDIIDLFCLLIRITLLVVLLNYFEPRALWVTVALVVSELISLVISTPISISLVPSQRVQWKKGRLEIAKKVTTFGGWWFLISLADTLKRAMDPIILNRFSSAFDVSILYVADIIPRLLLQVLMPITRPFLPVLMAMAAKSDFVRLSNTYTRTARYHSWVTLLVAVPVGVFSTEFMHLYLGGQYDEAGIVLSMLLIVSVINALNALGSAVVMAQGNVKGLSLRVVFLQLINLGFTLVFVYDLKLGAYGSAVASLLAHSLVETVLIWPFCWRLANTSFKKWFKNVFSPTVLIAIPSMSFCMFIKHFYSVNSWESLILFSSISCLINIILILVFGLRVQDRVEIGRLAKLSPAKIKPVLLFLSKNC